MSMRDEGDVAVVQPEGHDDGPGMHPDFVLDLLQELRANRYRPAAWARFAGRSWRRSQQTAQAHPPLVHSWRRAAVGLTAVEGTLLLAEARIGGIEGLTAARRSAP